MLAADSGDADFPREALLMVRAEITNLGVANPVTNVRCGFVDLRCEWQMVRRGGITSIQFISYRYSRDCVEY